MSELFKIHIGELLKSSDFSDVTIVSDDQKIFKGHRNILSGFSPVLNKLFKVDSPYHPALLYLSGINSSEINAIMEFIYCNTIPKTWTEKLKSAIITLEINCLLEHIPATQINLPSLPEIEIEKNPTLRRGLFSDHETIPFESKSNSTEGKDLIKKASKTEVSESNGTADESNVKIKLSDLVELKAQHSLKESTSLPEIKTEKTLALRRILFSEGENPVESQEYEIAKADDLISKATNTDESESNTIRMSIANGNHVKVKLSDLVEMRSQHSLNELQEKTEANDKTSQHESQHKGVVKVYKCEMCNFIASQRDNLQKHINRKHLGIKDDTPCDQCDYNPRDRRNLIKHKKVVHEGLRYPCNFCEYKSTSRTVLNNHISSIHKGIKHQCDQCGKQFSTSTILSCHIREFHEGIRIKVKCEFCEYHASKRGNLFVHFQKMHKEIDVEIFREKMRSSSRLRGPRKTTEESLGQEGQSKV